MKNENSKTYKILSIDAWADCNGCECGEDSPQCWTWNNWHNAGKTETIPENVEQFLTMLDENGYDCLKRDCWEIDDDGHNVVLIGKDNRKPYFAVEYGNQF